MASRSCSTSTDSRSSSAGGADVEELARRVRAEPSSFASAAELPRELRSRVVEHFHLAPDAFLERARADRALEALVATDAGDALAASGFESRADADRALVRVHGAPARELRRFLRDGGELALRLPADFRHEDTLARLGRDPESPSEQRSGARFAVAFEVRGRGTRLELELRAGRAIATVTTRGRTSRAQRRAAHRVAVRLLGVASDVDGFRPRARRVRGLAAVVRRRPGLRNPLTTDAFDALLWSIVGQQVNLAFAMKLRRVVIELAGGAPVGGLVPHPGPAAVAALDPEDLGRRQFSRRKAEYVTDTARAIAEGALDLEHLAAGSAVRAEEALLAVRGIGPWSANYVLMRGFGLADALPVGDAGLVKALARLHGLARRPDATETRERLRPIRPHRSLACMHLWRSLGDDPGQ